MERLTLCLACVRSGTLSDDALEMNGVAPDTVRLFTDGEIFAVRIVRRIPWGIEIDWIAFDEDRDRAIHKVCLRSRQHSPGEIYRVLGISRPVSRTS